MVVPFALAVGVGVALGIVAAALPWLLASAAACAALYMWNTWTSTPAVTADAGARRPSPLMSFLGLLILMGLLGGGGYLLGRLFGSARLDG